MMKKIMIGLCIITAAMSLTACQEVQKQANTGSGEALKEETAGRRNGENADGESTNKTDLAQKMSQLAGKEPLQQPDNRKEAESTHSEPGEGTPGEGIPGGGAPDEGAPGEGTPGERAAAALDQALIKGQTFQIGSDAIGSGYGEIYCFLEDHSYYWFASEFGDPYEQVQNRRVVFQSGTWSVEPTVPHGEVKPEEYTELLLTQSVADIEVGGESLPDPVTRGWFLEGAVLNRESLNESWMEISFQSGTVYINGDPAYPVSIPLTNHSDMYFWLERYVAQDAGMVNGGQVISIDYVYDQVNAVSDPVKPDDWEGSYKASDYSQLGAFINGRIRDIGEVDGEIFRQSQIHGEGHCTAVYSELAYVAQLLAEFDDIWDFTLARGTETYPYVVFNGVRTMDEGWSRYTSSLFVYVKETGNFVKYLDGVCSETAGMLETADGQDGEAWFLYHDPTGNLTGEGDILFPLNLRTGKLDYGRSVDTGMNLLGALEQEGMYQYAEISAWAGNPAQVLELRHVTVDGNSGRSEEDIWYLNTEKRPLELVRQP